MKYIFVGDIHGKVEAVEEALSRDGHKVFVGDFLDSFDRKDEDHEKCLDLALDASEKGEATLLWGNHELSYYMSFRHRCSGYRGSFERALIDRLDRITKQFKYFFFVAEDFLVTHAGLHPIVDQQLGKSLRELSEKELRDPSNPIHWIGYSRGGRNPVGGIFWCDFKREFDPIPGLNQVMGHSRTGGGILMKESPDGAKNFCIDCLDTERRFLEMDL